MPWVRERKKRKCVGAVRGAVGRACAADGGVAKRRYRPRPPSVGSARAAGEEEE